MLDNEIARLRETLRRVVAEARNQHKLARQWKTLQQSWKNSSENWRRRCQESACAAGPWHNGLPPIEEVILGDFGIFGLDVVMGVPTKFEDGTITIYTAFYDPDRYYQYAPTRWAEIREPKGESDA